MTTAGLIAKKIGMTRMVDADGRMTAVTLLQVEQQKVTKVLTQERDGYTGYQVGYYPKREKLLGKADINRLRKAGLEENYTRFKEVRTEVLPEGFAVGAPVEINLLEGVKAVDVVGITKGRGFAGAHVKHNAAVGRMSHGSRFHRRPGSLGMRSTPGRVFKNRHQPGHYGASQVTIQNLEVLDLDRDTKVLALRGSIPGHRDGYVLISPSVKLKAPKKKA